MGKYIMVPRCIFTIEELAKINSDDCIEDAIMQTSIYKNELNNIENTIVGYTKKFGEITKTFIEYMYGSNYYDNYLIVYNKSDDNIKLNFNSKQKLIDYINSLNINNCISNVNELKLYNIIINPYAPLKDIINNKKNSIYSSYKSFTDLLTKECFKDFTKKCSDINDAVINDKNFLKEIHNHYYFEDYTIVPDKDLLYCKEY